MARSLRSPSRARAGVRRRDLLKGAGLAAALPTIFAPRATRAQGSDWAALPASFWGASRPVGRILEIFLDGGLSAWESFYAVADPPRNQQWRTFETDLRARFQALPAAVRPPESGAPLIAPGVSLGLAAWPLWQRPDLLARMQVLVMAHDLLPHPGAIPLALTGSRLGRPQLAGTGAAVMRRFAVESVVPPAFVIDVADPVGEPALGTVLATGFHGASHTPLRLEVPCAGLGAPELARLERAADPAADRLLAHYAARFARRLPASSPGHGTRAYREYAASLGHYLHSADIHAALSGYASAPALPAPVTPLMSDFERCRGRTVSAVHKALELASYLLRRPDTRYVWVRDCGRSSGEQAGYDGHESLVSQTFPNLSSTLELLVTLLAGPDHLRLPDNTLVVLTTEFGRTPVEQEDQGGRNHWPAGYVNVVFRPARPGSSSAPTTIGEISAADGRAVIGAEPARNALNPTDLRAALLLALGIDPFESSNFAQGSLSGRFQGVIEAVARRRLKDLLGYGEVSA